MNKSKIVHLVYTVNQLRTLHDAAFAFGCRNGTFEMRNIPGNLLFRTKSKEYIDEALASGTIHNRAERKDMFKNKGTVTVYVKYGK